MTIAPSALALRETRPNEPGEQDEGQRSRPQRDRDAIIYTTAFRRLAGVTQVISPSEGLIVHNRLTHTLEVAQIALRLAEYLHHSSNKERINAFGGLDPNVVEASALAHDLGHPPFGHIAEKTLNKKILENGSIDGFEGNAQAFRIITQLAVRDPQIPGLNLTRATLNATLKYPWCQRPVSKRDHQQHERKWGAYRTEISYLKFARQLQPPGQKRWRSLEAQVMDWADDIAYSVSDTEDFYRAGLIPLDRIFSTVPAAHQFVNDVFERWRENDLTDALRGEFSLDDLRNAFVSIRSRVPALHRPYEDQREDRAALRAFTSKLIGDYVQTTRLREEPDSAGHFLEMPAQYLMEVRMLKELTWQFVIKNSSLAGQQFGQKRVVETLYGVYSDAIFSNDPDDWDILPARDRDARRRLNHESGDTFSDDTVVRLTSDAISGMTDQQALLMYHRLTGISPGGAFDTWAR